MVTHVLVSTRKSKERAEKLKKHLEHSTVPAGLLSVKIVKKGEDKYDVMAKPTLVGSICLGDVGSKAFASYLKVIQYGPDGEVI